MVSVQTAKSKGNQFEYDCQASLEQIFKDIYRTSERGFQQQYDLRTNKGRIVFECKRLKGISWNQAKKFLNKLISKAPKNYTSYLLFKSNFQPCLIMQKIDNNFSIIEFEDYFGIKFIKHKSTRNRKD